MRPSTDGSIFLAGSVIRPAYDTVSRGGGGLKVGKVVAQLKKHVNDNVRAKAQQVREAWSGLLPREPPPAPASNGVNGKPQVPSDGARCGIWRAQKGRVGWTCSCLGQDQS